MSICWHSQWPMMHGLKPSILVSLWEPSSGRPRTTGWYSNGPQYRHSGSRFCRNPVMPSQAFSLSRLSTVTFWAISLAARRSSLFAGRCRASQQPGSGRWRGLSGVPGQPRTSSARPPVGSGVPEWSYWGGPLWSIMNVRLEPAAIRQQVIGAELQVRRAINLSTLVCVIGIEPIDGGHKVASQNNNHVDKHCQG